MKKLAILLLAAGMMCCSTTESHAIDYKFKGQWIMSFDLGADGGFNDAKYGYNGTSYESDNFKASQRLHLQMEAAASEMLSGTVFFSIGDGQNGLSRSATWGKAAHGAALGSDGNSVLLKQAYIDWIVPDTALKLRMGIQGFTLPGILTNSVLDDDAAGITASYTVNDTVSVTALWTRLANDNYTEGNDANYLDNTDLFALILPLSFEGLRVTPWASYAAVGKNEHHDYYTSFGHTTTKDSQPYGDMWMLGITGEVTALAPFHVAWELLFQDYTDGVDSNAIRSWYGALLAEYQLNWGTPGLYAWYATGNNGGQDDGSGRMICLSEGYNQLSPYAMNGQLYRERNGVLGATFGGTWGVGARIKDMSLIDGLKHSFYVNYFGGTNDEDRLTLDAAGAASSVKNNLAYTESALEFGLTNSYKIYENLEMYSGISYVKLFYDDDLRKGTDIHKNYADAWNTNIQFIYSF